jgi:hypothetical protein
MARQGAFESNFVLRPLRLVPGTDVVRIGH